ncbi:hypothetical protein TNCV_4189981 [Trichonephila clavipes]|nr:hypothetical protein TNCV_4189981 [Trichonephila clavipes]
MTDPLQYLTVGRRHSRSYACIDCPPNVHPSCYREKSERQVSAEVETNEEKGETPVDVIKAKAKDDLNLVILSKERVDLDDDEIEEENPKLPKRNSKI